MYITKSLVSAFDYAVLYRDKLGTLYEVEPVGPVTMDEYKVRQVLIFPELKERLESWLRGDEMPPACCCERAIISKVLAQPWHEPEGSEYHVAEDDILNVVEMNGKTMTMTALQLMQRAAWTVTDEPEPAADISEPEPERQPDLSGLTRQQRRHLDRQQRKATRATALAIVESAGSIVMARSTGRFLVSHRSGHVDEPGTWSTWGGAVNAGETPTAAAERELYEETGFNGDATMIPLHVHDRGVSRYHNFLAVVAGEFMPVLNWESQDARWVEVGAWPTPRHYGLEAILADDESMSKIRATMAAELEAAA